MQWEPDANVNYGKKYRHRDLVTQFHNVKDPVGPSFDNDESDPVSPTLRTQLAYEYIQEV